MAEVVVIEFAAPGAGSIYMRVNGILGWNGVPGPEVKPEGLISSIAGESGDKLIVVETWESRKHQEKFMQTQLGPALAEAKAAQPSRVEWFTGVIDFHLD
ncbi:MAG: hypothetical protein LJF06_15995 [Gemmatimonadetes bacterium]|jgi:hypothetical protein|nr:hypothetical protein [Gemmatimonadota bacterium]